MTISASESAISTRAQHTPGPWAYWEPESDNGKWQIDAASGPMCPRKKIATVHTKLPGSEANARLIAAAPDMLAALKMVREVDDAYDLGFSEQERDKLHDAIARATGAA